MAWGDKPVLKKAGKKKSGKRTIDKKISGIGGWLLIPTIILFMSLFVYSGYIILGLVALIIVKMSLSFLFIISELLVFDLLAIFLIILEFRHNKKFPLFSMIYMWVIFFSNVAVTILENGNYSFMSIYEILVPIIWTLYFSLSSRVKNTFVK